MSVTQMNNISLPECLTCEKVCIALYRSPCQNQGEFEHLPLSLENLLGNIRNKDPTFAILLGDFNNSDQRVGEARTSQTMRIHKLNLSYHGTDFLS